MSSKAKFEEANFCWLLGDGTSSTNNFLKYCEVLKNTGTHTSRFCDRHYEYQYCEYPYWLGYRDTAQPLSTGVFYNRPEPCFPSFKRGKMWDGCMGLETACRGEGVGRGVWGEEVGRGVCGEGWAEGCVGRGDLTTKVTTLHSSFPTFAALHINRNY